MLTAVPKIVSDNRGVPTQKELAKLAGVSAGTVSNVITGNKRVSDEVRQKVLDAVRTLDYRPNLIARSLKTNRTNTLGIVIPEITVPFFPNLIRGAEFAARERGCFLILLDSDADEELELQLISLRRLRSRSSRAASNSKRAVHEAARFTNQFHSA